MGCDGGTIPKRIELVKNKKKPEQVDKVFQLISLWRYCALSHQLLELPIVICGLGKLYNKTAVIECLLKKNQLECPSHITSLKDVKELDLTLDKENVENKCYICPITGVEMDGKFRFVALWKCGCVFAEKALKEIETTTCPKCEKSFSNTDIIIINACGEDLERMSKNIGEKSNKRRRAKLREKPPVFRKRVKMEEKMNADLGKTSSKSEVYKSLFYEKIGD